MSTSLRKSDGFTLIEVLVATSIAAVGFLGLAATHVASIRATSMGRNVGIATGIAAEALETMRRLPYEQIVSASGTSVSRQVGNGTLTFTRQATVAAAGTTSKRVTIDVSWADQFGTHGTSGQAPGVQLITVITE